VLLTARRCCPGSGQACSRSGDPDVRSGEPHEAE